MDTTRINFMQQLVLQTITYPELNKFIVYYRDVINDVSILHAACKNSTLETVQELLNNGADVNIGMPTVLMTACNAKNIPLIELLLNNGADVHLRSSHGNAVLTTATFDTPQSLMILELLLIHGADINAVNNKGNSAFMLNCKYTNNHGSCLEAVKMLYDNGADIHIKNKKGENALMIACKNSGLNSNIETVQFLLEHGTNIHDKNYRGQSLLMVSFLSKNCSISTIKLLLELGVYDVDDIVYNNNNLFDGLNDLARDKKELLITHCSKNVLYQIMAYSSYRQIAIDEIDRRNAEMISNNKIKITNYERVLRMIPEHNAVIRYKIGNMGYKICQYDFDNTATQEIMTYLNANDDNIHLLVNAYLYDH